jgi:hypothetical protein
MERASGSSTLLALGRRICCPGFGNIENPMTTTKNHKTLNR